MRIRERRCGFTIPEGTTFSPGPLAGDVNAQNVRKMSPARPKFLIMQRKLFKASGGQHGQSPPDSGNLDSRHDSR